MADLNLSEDAIKQLVNYAVEIVVKDVVGKLEQDTEWLKKIEYLINQTVVDNTLQTIHSVDVDSVIKQHVDANIDVIKDQVIAEVTPQGIQTRAKQIELTILDQHVVVENQLITNSLNVVDTATIKNLSVTDHVDLTSTGWTDLKRDIANQTLDLVTNHWQEKTTDLKNEISNETLNLAVGHWKENTIEVKRLEASNELHVGETFSVVNNRVGINTASPEMALGLWDEDVSMILGKFKNKTGYVGTGRAQNLVLGVNREGAVEIDINGLTMIKKLQVGLNRIGHATEVPGWAGTKGDIIFNNNITNENNVFAWICLGEYKWKSLRTL